VRVKFIKMSLKSVEVYAYKLHNIYNLSVFGTYRLRGPFDKVNTNILLVLFSLFEIILFCYYQIFKICHKYDSLIIFTTYLSF
jgi:hypothetical protein